MIININTGGVNCDDGCVVYDDVLQFDVNNLVWTKISTMQQPRNYPAMSTVQIDDIINQCV